MNLGVAESHTQIHLLNPKGPASGRTFWVYLQLKDVIDR